MKTLVIVISVLLSSCTINIHTGTSKPRVIHGSTNQPLDEKYMDCLGTLPVKDCRRNN